MIISKKSTPAFAKAQAGGKAYNLYLLSQLDLAVPDWRCLSAKVFTQFLKQTQLDQQINSLIESISDDPAKPLKKTAEKIQKLIESSALPKEVESLIKKAYQDLAKPVIAVRSSALDEDSAQHSFAGQLSSYLYVRSEESALMAVKKCWASGFSERSLVYRIQNKISMTNISVAVLLQDMIDAEKSGVIFTCDPIEMQSDRHTINAVWGVGEGLVSGLLDADTYLVQKISHEILKQDIVSKEKMLTRSPSQDGLIEKEVALAFVQASTLSNDELRTLAMAAEKIEAFYRFPQDIEWAMNNGKLWILQSRPVTTAVANNDGYLYIWDNSNIIESYGGQTLPLTFGFAHYVYHQVYVQFCEILEIPHRHVRDMEFFLKNMLGIHYGRIYYNILNWYKLTSILPGFKYNRQFMETMMGTSHSLADEVADRIKPPGFQESFSSKIRRYIAGFKFLYFHFRIQSIVDNFLSYFKKQYAYFRKVDYSHMPADEIFQYYQELERTMLRKWHAPIINDYLCMVHFGLLKKLSQLWLSGLGESIQNDLLAGQGNIESAEPTKALIRMTQAAAVNSEIQKIILENEAHECLEILTQADHKDFLGLVYDYIDKYGFRCMNEMKLEEIDLYQDPSILFVFLKNNLKTGQTDLETFEKREKEIREKAEAQVKKSLQGIKYYIYQWSLKNARQAVRNRENTRFCRTRVYGVVRAMFYAMGRDFSLRGIISSPQDIFYLSLQELYGAFDGTLPVFSLKEFIELRKKAYQEYEATEPDPRFISRGPVYWMNNVNPNIESEHTPTNLEPHQLQGTPCSPGVIEGVAKVILSPKDNLDINKEILVTLRTDPGWIPLYPAASALLVERGGLLSHSAIVAREMGLPTIVGIHQLTKRIKSGDRLRINGQTGLIEILDQAQKQAET